MIICTVMVIWHPKKEDVDRFGEWGVFENGQVMEKMI